MKKASFRQVQSQKLEKNKLTKVNQLRLLLFRTIYNFSFKIKKSSKLKPEDKWVSNGIRIVEKLERLSRFARGRSALNMWYTFLMVSQILFIIVLSILFANAVSHKIRCFRTFGQASCNLSEATKYCETRQRKIFKSMRRLANSPRSGYNLFRNNLQLADD